MKACEGRLGRVFVIRLEDDDRLPECLERFAEEKGISTGHIILVGGIGGGEVIVGPRRSEEIPIEPISLPVDGAHEVMGVGVLAPDDKGKPRLHMHASLGRSGHTLSGDIRSGITVWLIGEAIIYEICDADVARIQNEETGFAFLEPGIKRQRPS